MSINPEIQDLINRFQRGLNKLEQNAAEGIDLVRIPLFQFLENTILVLFFAYLSNILFFIVN